MTGVVRSDPNLLTFVWRIENYSFCFHSLGGQLCSPVFSADDAQMNAYRLVLYPAGDTSADHIGLYLRRISGYAGLPFSFELSILTADGSVLKSQDKRDITLELNCAIGAFDFLERVEAFKRMGLHLLQDVLTVRCTVWWNPPSPSGTLRECKQISARTRIAVDRAYVILTMQGFSNLQSSGGVSVRIPPTSPEGRGMTLSSFVTEDHGEDKVVVAVACDFINSIANFTCQIYLVDVNGRTTACGKADSRLELIGRPLMVPLSLNRQALLIQKDKYLPNDTLTLQCHWAFSTRLEFNEVERIDHQPGYIPSAEMTVRAKKRRYDAASLSDCRTLSEDLRSLYDDRCLGDVQLKTETETFHAHKAVLAARSSVFRAMLTSDMKEKTSQCVRVEDLKDDAVRGMLHFLYTDELKDLQWDLATKLYYAADKYDVKALLWKCSVFLLDNLSISNAVELLVLADMHQDSRLKAEVEDFILELDGKVFGSDAWKTFMDTNPVLAAKTMHLKYTKSDAI